jgi:hypothetical protein
MRYSLPLLVFFAILLTACTAATVSPPVESTPNVSATLAAIVSATLSATDKEAPAATIAPVPLVTSSQPTLPAKVAAPVENQVAGQDLVRTDRQGAVEVDVTPTNLDHPGDTIDFEVGLNTHSVNLSMDLAKLATLKTDTGLTASAVTWDGEAGGHHVSGNLSFPSQVNGKSLLEGTKALTLVIQNVDAPERTFTWDIQP